jgi:hypothetical protein
MAKIYDLTSMLESTKSSIKIGEKNYEITNAFSDILKLEGLSHKKDTMTTEEFMMEFFTIAFGADNAKEILNAGYSKDMVMKFIDCIQESISEESIVEDGQNP